MTAQPSATCPECGQSLQPGNCAGLCPQCVAATMFQIFDAAAAPAPDGAPSVPGWLLDSPCGAGGQGVVWRALREEDDEPGAVKIFRTATPEQAARMEEEAAILTKLDHPGIVRVLDAGTLPDGRLFIVTAFVDGCDLARLMRASRLAPQRALDITRQIAAALDHAHSRGVVHRDLKPSNVMHADDGTVKLLDFSFASELGGKPDSLTMSGTAFGTPYYMAPERLRAAGPRGQRAGPPCDIYALGVMLYELLTGAPPLGRYARASAKAAVPPETDALIDALLSENPAARPDAAAVVRQTDDLLRLLSRSDARRKLRRRLQAAACVCTLAAAAWAAGYTMPHPEAKKPVPALNAQGFPNPATATRGTPWRNSLGAEFIPVPGMPALLMSKYETRMSEWKAFETGQSPEEAAQWEAAGSDTPGRIRAQMQVLTPAGWALHQGRERWPDPGFTPPENAPAWGINWQMAQRFCAWLTWREQREGRISRGERYRLPTDAEWSAAAGLPPEPGLSPHERHKALPDSEPRFPWGDKFPPPPGFGNYAGTEARNANWPLVWLSLNERNDDWPRLAPVGSFTPNAAGFHDLWGNVWEWCEDRASPSDLDAVLRGGSWVDGGYPAQFRRDFRFERTAGVRDTTQGFRCVLVFVSPA